VELRNNGQGSDPQYTSAMFLLSYVFRKYKT